VHTSSEWIREQGAPWSPETGVGELEADLAPPCRYPRRTILFHQGERPRTLYLIDAGLVKLSRSSRAGAHLVVGFRTAGWLLGAPSTLLDRPSPVTAETIGECELRALPSRALDALQQHAGAGRWLAWLQAREVHDLIRLAGQLGTLDLRHRLESLVMHLWAVGTPVDHAGSRRLPPLTHDDLAASISASRERVTKMIHRMEGEGLIQRRGGWIVVPASSPLCASAASDDPD
jgi:CRP/FNR family transcriptional regulator